MPNYDNIERHLVSVLVSWYGVLKTPGISWMIRVKWVSIVLMRWLLGGILDSIRMGPGDQNVQILIRSLQLLALLLQCAGTGKELEFKLNTSSHNDLIKNDCIMEPSIKTPQWRNLESFQVGKKHPHISVCNFLYFLSIISCNNHEKSGFILTLFENRGTSLTITCWPLWPIIISNHSLRYYFF